MLGGRSPRISAAARVLEGLAALLSRVESCFPGCASADRPAFHRIAGASEFQHLPAGLSAEIASKCTSLFAVGSIARPLAMHPVDDGLGNGSLKGLLTLERRHRGTLQRRRRSGWEALATKKDEPAVELVDSARGTPKQSRPSGWRRRSIAKRRDGVFCRS